MEKSYSCEMDTICQRGLWKRPVPATRRNKDPSLRLLDRKALGREG